MPIGALESWSRVELVEEVLTLRGHYEALLHETAALHRTLDENRTCEDESCRMCRACVTRLYVTAQPPPERIPSRYTQLPWRKTAKAS